jgi:hypothetical protein
VENSPLGVRHGHPEKCARGTKRERIWLELKARDHGECQLKISEETIAGVVLQERARLKAKLDEGPDDLATAGVTNGDGKKRGHFFRHHRSRYAKPPQKRLDCAGKPGRELAEFARRKHEAEERALADAQNEPLMTDVKEVGVPVPKLARGFLALRARCQREMASEPSSAPERDHASTSDSFMLHNMLLGRAGFPSAAARSMRHVRRSWEG